MILEKRIIKLIVLALGIFLLVFGIVFLKSSEDHQKSYEDDYGIFGHEITTRADTGIEFGADFYTTSARYTALAANTVTDLYHIVKVGMGVLFIFFGSIDICGVLYFSNINKYANKILNKNYSYGKPINGGVNPKNRMNQGGMYTQNMGQQNMNQTDLNNPNANNRF